MVTQVALEKLGDYYQLSQEALCERIAQSKKEQNAVLLVHNYQRLEIQALADLLGDSLELSRRAAETDADLIVFCGVHFMAESAKILSPDKKVLLPDRNAGCPMANMINAEQLCNFKCEHPGAAVVCYVNSSAEVKAESDICCTSANATRVVASLGDREILFVPDRNLADYARQQTGARIVAWDGYCHVHNAMSIEHVEAARQNHPEATLVVHPECPPEVVERADEVASTSGMIRLVGQSGKREFVIGTETGLVEQLNSRHADKSIYPLKENAVCGNMKLTDLAKLAWCLEHGAWEIDVPESIRQKAFQSLQRMVEL